MIMMNWILGGSTEEAQKTIGFEVASALIKYLNTGATLGAVNVPRVELRPPREGTVRILNMHQNIPGVLKVRIFMIYVDHGVVIHLFNFVFSSIDQNFYSCSKLIKF